jgi:hypothetical protein
VTTAPELQTTSLNCFLVDTCGIVGGGIGIGGIGDGGGGIGIVGIGGGGGGR